MYPFRVAALLAVSYCAVLAQTTTAPPAFEHVDVHPSAPGKDTSSGGFVPGNRFELRAFTVLQLISMATGVWEEDKVIGGPNWISTDKFDIIANVPPSAPRDALQSMMRALMTERFGLAVHEDSRPFPVYLLTVGKKPTMKESAEGGRPGCQSNRDQDGLITLTCSQYTVAQFAQRLNQAANGYFDHPLIDKTGLTAKYDFTIHWTARGLMGVRNADGESTGISAFNALEKDLGLKATLSQQPLPVVVIDHVNRTPTENAPDVKTAPPPAIPTEFEVGEIKVSKPGQEGSWSINAGRVQLFAITPKDLLQMAFNLAEDEMLAGEPKWVDTDKLDVIAKASKPVPFDSMQVMLQKLITDTLKLKYHMQDLPIPVYGLTVGKLTARMKPADPANRSNCKKTPADGLLTLTCQNTTMAQFADQARQAAPGYVNHPVVDLTGLNTAYDFAVSWAPSGRTQGGRGGDAAAAGSAAASAPTGDLTFFEAIEKQLGLKLQSQKHPMPVMVVDHIEKPADQ